ncbi:MAG TPA: S8 family serine peptidase, partial [Bacteroidales bacterium]
MHKTSSACLLLVLIFFNLSVIYAGNGNFVLVKIKKSYPVSSFLFNDKASHVSPLIKKAVGQFRISRISRASTIDDDELAQWIRIDFQQGTNLSRFKTNFSALPFVEKVDEIPDRNLNEEWCSEHFTESWYLNRIHCPVNLHYKMNRPLKIAIVDDAFRLTHEMFRDFIWKNPKEIPGNHFDDDGNGYIDDLKGWDVSDGDNDVSPPPGRLKEFYHGTYIAGIIATILTKAYGKKAPEYFKIIPVKCVSDFAEKAIIRDGYKGIEYAIKAGADIINCSWAGDYISDYEKDLLRVAKEKNILIVASAGNLYAEREEYPAAYTNVMAVAAVDSMDRKLPFSNYGEYVRLSSPGINICGAGV